MKIAILTSPNQWFENYIPFFKEKFGKVDIYHDHNQILIKYEILFIISYHEIINKKILNQNQHNLVIHESALPEGRGWAPLFWQILSFNLFNCSSCIQSGNIIVDIH